jgi:hypothetical protein
MMDNPPSLATAPLEHPAMDYAFLRQAGIRHLERMAGQLWTDFNAHDPGITILEQLCYALTDLGYRIDYDLKDLLATGEAEPYRSLYSPAEILTSNPVTLTDLRKVLIDVDGVKNAWIEPVAGVQPALYYDPADQSIYLEAAPHRAPAPLQGIHRVLIEADESQLDQAVIQAAQQRLQARRNLAEDFEPPIILNKQPIRVTATIEVRAIEDPDQLLAEIYHALASFISPHIRFYSLADMLARGKRIDEIMDGPVLQHGFIDTAELEGFERKTGLRTSDLIQEIMNLPGASAVDDIAISDGVRTEAWYLNLNQAGSQNSTPVLDIDRSLIQLVRNGAVAHSNPKLVKQIFDTLQQAGQSAPLTEAQRDIRLPAGRDRNVGRYYSIQHQFPAVYGIGELGLPASAPAQRQAQAKQLKAYLLFFDQLLANYFAQLAHVNELFSFYSPQSRTYFSQLIDDTRLALDDIWVNDRDTRATHLQSITEDSAAGAPGDARKNRFLNHLLARFAEEFTDYSLHVFAQSSPADLIDAKSAFLRDYRELGAARGRAFDYTLPAWGAENVSGLEKRISRKLGLASYRRRDLADLSADDAGGFHMLEPILLRPRQADLSQWKQAADAVGWQTAILLALPQTKDQPQRKDPFSLRLSFVFPDWISRFDHDFVWRMLREESPAHLNIHLLWLSREHMRVFEAAYKDWLESMITGAGSPATETPTTRPAPLADLRTVMTNTARDARDRLIDLLGIGAPYPLRDLALSYLGMVAVDQPAEIQILGGQAGVQYQLCDEDGNPIVDEQGHRFEVVRAVGQAGDQVILPTPKIVKDITYTILAAREVNAYGVRLEAPLETYLTTSVSIKAGINTALPVELRPAADQVGAGRQITVNYGDIVTVAIGDSQEGISYMLVTDPHDSPLSEPVQGNKATIVLMVREANKLTEDTMDIRIKAYRTLDTNTSAYLSTTLAVNVRPDRAVAINVAPSAPPIVDYAAQATLSLAGPQSSVEYQLYQRELVPADYVLQETPGRLEIEGQHVFVRAPQRIANWDDPAGFALVGSFQKKGRKLSITTSGLLEDMLFIVLATKTANRERLQLDQAVVVLVRPDPAPQVGAAPPSVPANTEGTVTVKGTQKGVVYQLRLDADNTPINAPGYHYEDRGLETTRLAVDFVVEAPGDPLLLLPTRRLTAKTTFNVLATKVLTGVNVPLTGKATIDVEP